MAALSSSREEDEYRDFVTDALIAIAENTTYHVVPGYGEVRLGQHITMRWGDRKKQPEKEPPEDNRPCAEIAAEIWERIRHGR